MINCLCNIGSLLLFQLMVGPFLFVFIILINSKSKKQVKLDIEPTDKKRQVKGFSYNQLNFFSHNLAKKPECKTFPKEIILVNFKL